MVVPGVAFASVSKSFFSGIEGTTAMSAHARVGGRRGAAFPVAVVGVDLHLAWRGWWAWYLRWGHRVGWRLVRGGYVCCSADVVEVVGGCRRVCRKS